MKNIIWKSDCSHRTKEGVQYWGIAKEMELIYTIETTKHDEEVKIDFSNVNKSSCKSMNEVMKKFNLYQKQGFKNIQITTDVFYEGETIIEDTSECLELSINSEDMQQLKNDSRQLESASQEVAAYKGFIKQYKAEKAFEKYMTEHQNSNRNKDIDGLYWYELRLRPVSIGCQPNGFTQTDDTKGRHGIIAYDRPLTIDEVKEYELSLWNVS
ncbi:hypothetical protein [Paenibacillus xylanexedens]|uniref:defense against restriction DarA-related protein n=1 Tax=Paenibacillus xylanexedens TaxID=528191 RepID=UPI000F5407A5|nr:hypothetical protein [Paenibacillus xylanexedens]